MADVVDNNPEVVTNGNAVPMHLERNRPTFHLSHGMVCFVGGVGITLAIMYLISQMNGKKSRD